jgi:CHAT domain-containing protein
MEICMRRTGPLATASALFLVSLFARSAAGQAPPPNPGSSLGTQIAEHEQKLTTARSTKDLRNQVVEMNTLCNLYRQIGESQKGLDDCNQALAMETAANNKQGMALTQNIIGRIYIDLGQEQKALDIFNQIMPVWRETNSVMGQASTLTNMGMVFSNLGQKQKALDTYNQALPMWRQAGNKDGEATTLDNIGRVYSDLGQNQDALDNLNKSLPLWQQAGNRAGEALTTTNLGKVYADLGQKQQALDAYKRAVAEWREVGNRQGEALALDDIGRVYSDLAQRQQALDYFNQALPLYRAVGSKTGEALALNDIGRVYADLAQAQRALDFYNQALPLWQQAQNRRGEAQTLGNLSRTYLAMGNKTQALTFDTQSVAAWRDVGDRRGEAFALNIQGRLYSELGQHDQAAPAELAALSLATAAGDPIIEGGIETSLMLDFRALNRPEEAIFFGKEAVNNFQKIRQNIAGLDEDLQSGFTQSKSQTYRELAEILVQQGRLSEAEDILDLLKEQELREIVRGADDAQAKVEPVALTDAQKKAESDLATPEQASLALTDVSIQYAVLAAKAGRTPQETAQMNTLEMKIEAQNADVSDFFKKTLYPELAQRAGAANANAILNSDKSDVSRLQNTLAQLGPHVIGIRLLLGEQSAYVILVTAQGRTKFELKATPAELRRKVLQVRDDLRNPSSDPKPHLAELYAMVVSPFEAELAALEKTAPDKDHVPTLLWSLDGVMRYLPMPALYDGQHYLLERFNNILFTPESYGHMSVPAGSNSPALRVLAMGLSKSYGGLPALPGVLPELDSVAHDPSVPDSHGPMDGVLLPNEQFTFAAMEKELGAGSTFPVVHIASHFVMEAGSGDEPYLMLGGNANGDSQGYQLTLSKLDDSPISFHGTHLLTLSACSTAKGDVAEDGEEVDSLAMIAQQKDAEAVMATLWDVNDASTSRIMSDFYARWVKNPADGKAEALRQAQLAMLHGPAASGSTANYPHPYYWAPFVLSGNYQ